MALFFFLTFFTKINFIFFKLPRSSGVMVPGPQLKYMIQMSEKLKIYDQKVTELCSKKIFFFICEQSCPIWGVIFPV